MELTIILGIIFIHWFADFVCQAEDWALNKSKNNLALFKHVLTYSLIWFYIGACLFSEQAGDVALFTTITFICHFLTDYITSKVVSKKFKDGHLGSPIPNFGAFTVIGFDQVLHYVQLFITYKLLFH